MDDRLKAVDELVAKGVDGIVVVGSTTSANTHRLLERAEKSVPAALVNGAGMLDCFLAGKNLIGLTAGASTPDEIILEVENEIRNY
jgi:4-hydroxy-3-methylbut-2-enyl diphosphate reductase